MEPDIRAQAQGSSPTRESFEILSLWPSSPPLILCFSLK